MLLPMSRSATAAEKGAQVRGGVTQKYSGNLVHIYWVSNLFSRPVRHVSSLVITTLPYAAIKF